jgi:hypothetical protein
MRVAWTDITRVIAYKRDCYAYDQIRVAIFTDADVATIDLSEDDGGYRVLTVALPAHLRGCMAFDVWFQQVAPSSVRGESDRLVEKTGVGPAYRSWTSSRYVYPCNPSS